jgi:hypothetical protein
MHGTMNIKLVTETSYAFTFTDIAVVTTSEINLFSDTGNLTGKLPKPTAELQSLEFDPVNEVLFVSDDTNSNVSIYTLDLRGDGALKPFIQSENCIILVFSCQLNLLYGIKICSQNVSHFRFIALMDKQGSVSLSPSSSLPNPSLSFSYCCSLRILPHILIIDPSPYSHIHNVIMEMQHL